MEITDSIQIKATPERVFNFLTGLKDNESYRAWHPDHVVMQWLEGEPFAEGSLAYCEEYLHGDLHKFKFKCTKVVPNRFIEYRPLFPASLFAPGNQFIIEPVGDDSCTFTAKGKMRMGPLFQKLHQDRIEGGRKHMEEEGRNLKAIMEKG